MKSRFTTLSHWLQRKKAQPIAPALLTAYGGVTFQKESFVQDDLYKQKREYDFHYNQMKRSRNFLFAKKECKKRMGSGLSFCFRDTS